MPRSTRKLSIIPILGVAALLAGCAGADASPGSGASEPSQSLPEEVRDAGVINVGGPVQAPPYIYRDDDREIVGLTVDLMDAVGEALGVEVEFHDIAYDSAFPALEAGRIDVFTGSYTDTAERQETVDFVDYYLLQMHLVVSEDNPKGITGMDDMCGNVASAPQGSSPSEQFLEQSDVCEANGDEPVTLNEVPGLSEVKLQLESGRADTFLEHLPGARWLVSDGQPFEMVDEPVSRDYAGAALSKDRTDLRDALVEGFDLIMESGEYERILEEWEASEVAIPAAVVNGTTTQPLEED